MLSRERLQELLAYDPETGIFTWRTARPGVAAGSIAGSRRKDGYLRIGIDGKTYRSHRLAFLYMTGSFPSNQVDHIDHCKTNNRWCNLREVTSQENSRNIKRFKNNISGVTGVCWSREKKKWRSFIADSRRWIHLGYFKCLDDAKKARVRAEARYGFHKNHGVPTVCYPR